MLSRIKDRYIGNRAFYSTVIAVAVPIMIQSGVTNFVSLLDNVMVGQLGTESMSGVAIVNQLIFVFNLAIFGASSGAGIFGAQFYGNGDVEGFRHTFRFKVLLSFVILVIGLCVLRLGGIDLVSLFLNDTDSGNVALTLLESSGYLGVILLGLIPFTAGQVYSSTLRETGRTVVPMIASVAAVFVNLSGNYILIFGKFGAPQLGVRGAAIATVIARFVECAVIIVWTHTNSHKTPFMQGLYKSMRIPAKLAGQIAVKGAPLLMNEVLWAVGMAVLMQSYSLRGLNAVAALNISSTVSNFFAIVYMAMGSAVAIIVGQLLGASQMEKAQDSARKLIAFSIASCLVVGVLLGLLSPYLPLLYKTPGEVRDLASAFILMSAFFMPLHAFMFSAYFTLRSGGRTFITFLFDSVFLWVVSYPLAFFLSRYTNLYILPLYLIVQLADLIKCAVGYILLKKGIWLRNIVSSGKTGI